MKTVCNEFFCCFSTDSKVTWQKAAAWLFNKGEAEIYKPSSSDLVYFLGRKIKRGAAHVASPGLSSCPVPQQPLRWLHSEFWDAVPRCGCFLLNSERRISNTLWRQSISATALHPRSPRQQVLNSGPLWRGELGGRVLPEMLSLIPRREVIAAPGICYSYFFRFSLHLLANPSLLQPPIEINNSLY